MTLVKYCLPLPHNKNTKTMTIEKNTTFKDATDSYATLTATGKVKKAKNYTQSDISHEFKMTFKNPAFTPMMVTRSESYISDYMTKTS